MLKRNFLNMAFAAFAIMLLVVACSPANTDLSGTASLTVVANMPTGSGSKSIMPDADSTKPDKIIIELTQAGSEDVVQAGSFDYQESAEYTLNNIKIGTYTVTIKGTKADREGVQQQIMSGSSPITITADGENSCNVKLAFGSDGKGALEVKLVWEDLNSSSSPIADAIKNDSLGFLAYYNSGSHKDQPISGDLTDPSQLNDKIDWVDNVSSGEHIYYEYAEATGQAAADIYFIIYTKDSRGNITAVAKTFYSTLTIYPNILSIPDDNEISNFRLTASNVQGYLKNVTDVNVGIDEKNDPSGTLIVTWNNPDFSENVFPMDVVVKIVEENGTYTKTNREQFNNAEASAAGGKTVFSGLNPNSTYSFYFKINGNIGYSLEELKASGQRTRGVTAITFASDINSAYIVGDTVTVDASITPAAADQEAFTIVEKNGSAGVEINNETHQITFKAHGDYAFTLVADENEEVESEEKSTTVRLAAPGSVTAKCTSSADDGIEVSWQPVTGATGYTIYRNGSSEPLATNVQSPHNDTDIVSGATYYYTVKATAGDSKFDSDVTRSGDVTTDGVAITIELPKVSTAAITESLSKAVNGKYIDTTKPETFFSIVLENEISGATEYIWKLNGKEALRGDFNKAAGFNLETKKDLLITDSADNSNAITLEIEMSDGIVSGTVYIPVFSGTPKTISSISDEDVDGTITYKVNSDQNFEQLTVNFNNDGDFEPFITWKSLNKDIATVDEYTGIVTPLKKGNATIQAISSTGESETIELTVYVPVTKITINSPENNILIVEKKGVVVDDSHPEYESFGFSISISSGKEGVETSLSVDDVLDSMDYDSSVINIDIEKGTVNPVGAGKTKLTVKADDVSESIAVIVFDFDIYYNYNKANIITGKEPVLSGVIAGDAKKHPLNIFIENNRILDSDILDWFSFEWQFENGETTVGTPGYFGMEISGTGLAGEIVKGVNADSPTINILIYDKSKNKIGYIWFKAKAT